MTEAVPAKAYTVEAADPVPVKGRPPTMRTSPDCGARVIGFAFCGDAVPPNCTVSNTGEVEVLFAYSHTSSMIDADVPVAWIVVPVEAVATTVVGAPTDELDRSTFVYVAIFILSKYLH
jgi:hypothetical protein